MKKITLSILSGTIFLLGMSTKAQNTYTEGTDMFGGGLVSIPAENYTSIRVDPDGNNAFNPSTDVAGYNNDSYLQAETDYNYNNSANFPSGVLSDLQYAQDYAPALSYQITFTQAGDHYLKLHKMFLDGASDSFFWSLDAMANDGVIEGSGQKVQGSSATYGEWDWKFADGPLSVPSAGDYVLTIYMREGNVKLDHIIISTDAAFDQEFDDSWVLSVDSRTKNVVTANVEAIGSDIVISNLKSNAELKLYSISGKLVKTIKTQKDTSFSFKSGLWIANLKTKEGEKSFKLLVK